MFLITFLILGAKGAVLQSIPNKINYQFPKKEQECQNIELMENQNFYLEIPKESNIFYRFSNNFQELLSDKWNLTFMNFISQVEIVPDYFSILQIQYLKFDDGMYICSLLQNLRNLDYSIQCKNLMEKQQIIELQFLILYEEGLKCNSFIFFNHLFYILCLIEDQMQIITFDLKENKQQIIYTSPLYQCNVKFQLIRNFSFLLVFYECINWQLLIYDNKLQGFKIITDEEIYIKARSNSNKYLQDLIVCQNHLYFIFDHEYFKFVIFALLFSNNDQIHFDVDIDNIDSLQLTILLSCTKQDSQVSDFIIHKFVTDFETKNLKSIMKLGQDLTLLIYSDHLIATLTKEISQTFYIDNNQVFYYQKMLDVLLIIDKYNKLNIFEIDLIQNYFIYQQNARYVGFYTINNQIVELFKCFAINQRRKKQEKLKSQYELFKNQSYIFEIDDYFQNVMIQKSDFQLQENLKFDFIFPNIFQLNINQKESNKQCYMIRQKVNSTSKFIIFKLKSTNYLMFNKKDNLVIYNCQQKQFSYFNLKIDLNTNITHYSSNTQLILVQENKGRIIIFELLTNTKDPFRYQINQFKESIRISFTYQNQLIIQLQHSKQLFFQDGEKNTFLNLSFSNTHYFNDLSNFKENIKDAIKVLNFNNTFIFQHDTFLIVQIEMIVTQIIDLNIILLGGFQKRSHPLYLILIGINKEMNRIDKYLITKTKFYNISSFQFQDYIPIQPLEYQILDDNLIITTQKQNKDQFHILLFFIDGENPLHYQEIISTPYLHFYAISGILHYYNQNQEMTENNIKYFSYEFGLQDLNQIVYSLQLQLNIKNSSSQNDQYIYSEKSQLLVINYQEKLQCINEINQTIILNNNNQAILNPNNFVHGVVENFQIQNVTIFTLNSPFKIISQRKCLKLKNKFCVIEYSPQFKVQDITKNIEYNQTYTLPIKDNTWFHVFDDGIIIITQIDLLNIKIQYFKDDTEKIIIIQGTIWEWQITQQILMILTNEFKYYYYINEEITFIYSCLQSQVISFHQIETDKICQILIALNQIDITCFQIKQGVILQISNYTVPNLDIYNSINISNYLQNFSHQVHIQILNLTFNEQNVLNFKIIVFYKGNNLSYGQALIFCVEIILKNQENLIRLNNIIRLPKFTTYCIPLLLQNNLLMSCNYLKLYMYQLQNQFQILNPYAVHSQLEEELIVLNNTHLALFQLNTNEVKIIQIDFWRLVKNDNITLDDEQNVTFLFKNLINQLEIKVKVENQRILETNINQFRYGIIVINCVFIQIFIFIKKQKRM